MCARESKEMNIDEKMEMVMANEEVKNLSHKEKRAARPAFFLLPPFLFTSSLRYPLEIMIWISPIISTYSFSPYSFSPVPLLQMSQD